MISLLPQTVSLSWWLYFFFLCTISSATSLIAFFSHMQYHFFPFITWVNQNTGIEEKVRLVSVPDKSLTHLFFVTLRNCSIRGSSNNLSALKKRKPAEKQECQWKNKRSAWKFRYSDMFKHACFVFHLFYNFEPSKRG